MTKFNFIINPHTKEKLPLFGQDGGAILANYVNIYKKIRNNQKGKNTKTSFKQKTQKTNTVTEEPKLIDAMVM